MIFNQSLLFFLIFKGYSSRLDQNLLKTQNYTISHVSNDGREKIGFIKRFYLIQDEHIYLLVQKLRTSTTNALVKPSETVMHHQKDDNMFLSYFDRFLVF